MHSRWIAVYNANLDRSPALRKRPAELRAEMRRWEEERQRLRKEPLPLKTDIAEYRVRAPFFLWVVLRHNRVCCSVQTKQSLTNLFNSLARSRVAAPNCRGYPKGRQCPLCHLRNLLSYAKVTATTTTEVGRTAV